MFSFVNTCLCFNNKIVGLYEMSRNEIKIYKSYPHCIVNYLIIGIYAEQKHPGCEPNQKQPCKQVCATKNFEIS